MMQSRTHTPFFPVYILQLNLVESVAECQLLERILFFQDNMQIYFQENIIQGC